MIADVDILVSRMHDWMIAKSSLTKFIFFTSLNTIALRATLPCRCNLVKRTFEEILAFFLDLN